MKNKKQKLIGILIFLVSILLIYFYIFNKYGIGIPCVFHMITGYYCPGCGITRAILSLLKFDLYQAIRYNALVTMLLAIAILYLINFIQNYFYNQNKKIIIKKEIVVLFLIITLAYGLLRNIPYFEYLAPTII